MNRKRLILIAVGLVVMVGAAVWWMRRGHGDKNRIVLSGNIELTQVDISFKVPGKLVERNFDEGAAVKKGDVVARIDSEQVQRQRSRDAAGLTVAQSQLTQGESSVQLQRATSSADLDLRRAELRQAQALLDQLLAGSRPQELQQAQDAAADMRTQHQQASLDWERAQTLFKNDDISRQQYDQARTKFESTAAQQRQAEEKLALVKEGPRKEEIESARAQVARANAAVKLSNASRLELERRVEDLSARRGEVARSTAQIGITDAQLSDTTVASPISGYVLVKAAEVGEVLAAGSTVVTIGDLDHPWVRAYVNEKDLGRVKLGTKARITSDSYPGKSYDGRVTFISSEAEFTPKQIQTQDERVKLVYRIKIEVDNRNHELKSNAPVDAELILDAP